MLPELVVAGCIFLGCAEHQRIHVNVDYPSLDDIDKSNLSLVIKKRTVHYENLKGESLAIKPQAELTLGYLHYRNKAPQKAIKYFSKTLTYPSFNLKDYAHYYLAKIDIENEKCEAAKPQIAILNTEFKAELVTKKINSLWQEFCAPQKKLPKRISLKKRKALEKLNLFEQGISATKNKRYRAAIKIFKTYLNKAHPKDPNVQKAMIKLASIYKKLRMDKKRLGVLTALSRFKRKSKQFPYNPKWLLELAKFHWNKNNLHLTKKYLHKLIASKRHAHHAQSYYILGRISANERKFRAAKKYMDRALRRTKDAAFQEEIQYLRGWYGYRADDFVSAISAYQAFREQFPNSDSIHLISYWLAKFHLKINNNDDAEELFTEIADTSPHSYYGIRSLYQLDQPFKPATYKNQYTFNFSKKAFGASHVLPFKKGERLIYLGMARDGSRELRRAASYGKLTRMPWDFQLYMATLYSLGRDDISSIIIMNNLKRNEDKKLPKEYISITYPKRYWSLLKKYGKRFNIDPYLLLSVMRQESAFDPNAISPADAYGLLQMTPYVARAMTRKLKKKWISNEQLLDPETNIELCAYFLSDLLKKHNDNLVMALATYNANPRAVKRWIKRFSWVSDIEEFIEEIPYKETRTYVKLVLRNYTNNLYIHEGKFQVYP